MDCFALVQFIPTEAILGRKLWGIYGPSIKLIWIVKATHLVNWGSILWNYEFSAQPDTEYAAL